MRHALGRTGRARGEEDGGGGFGLRRGECDRRRLGLHQALEARFALLLLGTIGNNAERKAACLTRGKIAGAIGVGEDDLGAAHLERVVDLGRRVAIVQRRHDEAGFEAGEIMRDEGDAVRHQGRHAVAGLKPEGKIMSRKPVGAALKLGPGPGPGALQRYQSGRIGAILEPGRN